MTEILDKIDELENLWNKTLKNLGDEMAHSKFEAWIRPIEPVSLEKKTLTIATNDNLSREWISRNYKDVISDTLKNVTGRKHRLEIVLKKEADIPVRAERKPVSFEREKFVTRPEKTSLKEEVKANIQLPQTPVNEFQINALKSTSSNLNLKYTFDSFIVGDNNKFAYSAALAVAKNPSKNHNPLFIYGGAGLGKTHLMQAVGHYILANHPKLKIKYTNTEAFMNELVNSIRAGRDSSSKMSEFRQKYRNVDVFMIDDIQFLENKKATQDEIFHTFEYLYNAGKQIIITSDRPPKAIPTLTDRLRSRFEWGLLADIQVPDFKTRVEILQKRVKNEKLDIPQDVIEFIANAYQNNVRELEGALNRVMAYSSISNLPVNMDTARGVIDIDGLRPSLSIDKIIDSTAEYFGIKADDIKSSSKSKNIAQARQVGVYLSRDLTNSSFPAIGEAFGGRKHTTIMYSFDKIKNQMSKNLSLKEQISELSREICAKYSRI